MDVYAVSEGSATRFTTAGGTSYTIWVATDPQNDLACTIRVVPEERHASRTSPLDQLTPRERDVAQLVIAGWTNAEIADKLFISESTVKSHVKRIYEKLDVANRATLTRFCLSNSAA